MKRFSLHFCTYKLKRRAMEVQTNLQEQINDLTSKLTGEMFHDMEIKDQIHNLTMKLKGVKPMDTHIDCVGCGS